SWIFGEITNPAQDGTAANRLAKQSRLALCGPRNRQRDLHQCRLPRAIWAEQSENRAGLNGKAHIVQRVYVPCCAPPAAECLREGNRFECSRHGFGLYAPMSVMILAETARERCQYFGPHTRCGHLIT